MTRTIWIVLPVLLLVAALNQGCLTHSVHPLCDSTNSFLDSGLVGNWVDAEEGDVHVNVTIDPRKGYIIQYDDKGQGGNFIGRLTVLGKDTILQVTTNEFELDSSHKLNVFSLLPCYAFLRLATGPGTVKLRFFSPEWIVDDTIDVPHVLGDESPVLSLEMSELRRFIKGSLQAKNAWEEEWSVFMRSSKKLKPN